MDIGGDRPFEISHHPIDLSIVTRATDYIVGRDAIDDLVAEAVRLERNRIRANAWGCALVDYGVAGLNPDLHVWGRPFLVIDDARLGSTIDRYLSARDDREVDAIAREQVALLDPALPDRIAPRAEAGPSDPELTRELRQSLDLLRAAWASDPAARIRLPNAIEVTAEELLWRDAAFAVVTFAAHFRPGWMEVGYAWPTLLWREARLADEELFEPPQALLGPLTERRSQRYFPRAPTISDRSMVGGYVRPSRVPALRARLEASRDALENAYAETTGRATARGFTKLIEAVRDAEERGLGFAEAAEVYSGVLGFHN